MIKRHCTNEKPLKRILFRRGRVRDRLGWSGGKYLGSFQFIWKFFKLESFPLLSCIWLKELKNKLMFIENLMRL